jgi:O-antigen/teichoic acid export membrane protein
MGKEDSPGDVGDGNDAGSRGKLAFVVRSAASLATSTVVTAGIGFIYWALAARTFPVNAVGESSTAISAVSLLAPLSIVSVAPASRQRISRHKESLQAHTTLSSLLVSKS